MNINNIKVDLQKTGEVISKIVFILMISLLFNLVLDSKAIATDFKEGPTITSEAAILMEEKTGRILYEKNSDLKMYPASLTKVATAIYAIERGNLEDIVTVSQHARQVDGTRIYLEEGEKVPLKKLIQGLLINSGNDAGVAIAEHLDGTEEEFAININTYLKKIGLKDTNFTNPHGLFNPDHTTTAQDLAKITKYALKNEEFREIFGTKELKWDGESWDTTLYTHHKLMRERPYEGVTGGKTGYVDQSGNTLITTADKGGMSVIAVVLKGKSQDEAYNDTVELLDYAFTNFNLVNIPVGKEYLSNNTAFVSKEMYSFPILNNEDIIEEITKEGILIVKNQYQERIASFPLKKIQKPGAEQDIQNSDNKDENVTPANKSYLLAIIAILVIYLLSRFSKYKRRLRKSRSTVPNRNSR